MSFLEEEYLRRVSYKLRNFTAKGNHTFNFSCPICGDSKKKLTKARGYAFDKNGSLITMCHNCGHSTSFPNFLKTIDPLLFEEFVMERFKDRMGASSYKEPEQTFDMMKELTVKTKSYSIFTSLTELKYLPEEHPAVVYALGRHLNVDEWELYYAPKFFDWAKTTTEKFDDVKGKDHARIIIPFRAKNGEYIGYTARTLGDETPKYYRVFLDDDDTEDRFFGLHKLDTAKQVYVVEGEIDSLFLPNAVAVCNGKLNSYMNKKAIYIPDTDKRNPHIVKFIENMLNAGLRVCLLPDNLPGKDINDLVKAGLTQEKIVDIINANVYQGLSGKLKFNTWRVVK